ncbi:hypothetical protein HELRODRAFT_94381 [Helobdella robusta]|uniref:ATP-binding cassette sub-family B member 10, mitochondrial n=1 Tax=Helobdella robusta TaxID=6412 RepID=T1G907_HELRO|nr:hypothetical protein HELRODRAFT_94381 [Helobdella robusta]ESO02078.1 hypothetical protein HELRODRAFT_94381 [Helobdella robusta]
MFKFNYYALSTFKRLLSGDLISKSLKTFPTIQSTTKTNLRASLRFFRTYPTKTNNETRSLTKLLQKAAAGRFASTDVRQPAKTLFPVKDSVLIKRLLTLAKPERARLCVALTLLLISSCVTLVVPFGIGRVIDIIYTTSQEEVVDKLSKFCGGLLFIFVIGAIANFGRIVIMQTSGNRIIKRLQQTLFGSLMKQDISFFDKNKTGELMNRLSVDTALVGNTLTMNISDGLRSVLQAFGGVSWMVYTCPQLAAISMCIVPPLAILSRLYGRFVKNITTSVQEAQASAAEIAEERISNIRTVQAFVQEQKERMLYNEKLNNVLALSFREAIAKGVFWASTGFSGNLTVLLLFYFGGKMVSTGTITVGELSSFLVYAAFVGVSIGGISSFYAESMKGVGSSTRIFELIDRKPTIPDKGEIIPSKQLKGNVKFDNIQFSYPLRPGAGILHNLNLYLPSGSVTAIVGPSGSGKSTLASLLLRFYDPVSGSVVLDDMDIKTLNTHWLRKNMSIVSQDPILFSTSIANNICYGASDADNVSSDQIIEAACKANAHSFIEKFPQGYDTMVGERGIMLSGGQRQRIAIARAIIKNPKILILDEATSALDAESEHLVQEALVRVMEGRTVLVIAHRLSTIRRAQQIAVLDGGKACEIGTYEELMSKEGGPFRKLVERQMGSGVYVNGAINGGNDNLNVER